MHAQPDVGLVRSTTLSRILLENKVLINKLDSSQNSWPLSNSCTVLVNYTMDTTEPFLFDEKLCLNPWTEERWELLDMMTKLSKFKDSKLPAKNNNLVYGPSQHTSKKNKHFHLKSIEEHPNYTEEENKFHFIPREIWANILSFVNPVDICHCRATCRALALYGDDDQLWMSVKNNDTNNSSYEFEKMRKIYETFRVHSKRGNIVDFPAFANVVSSNLTKQVLAKSFRPESLSDDRWAQIYRGLSNFQIPLITEKLFAFFDKDNDGVISFVDFANGYTTLRTDVIGKMKFLFNCFDLDESGYISKEDLTKFVHNFLDNYQHAQKRVEQVCNQLNIDASPILSAFPTSSIDDLNAALNELFTKLPESVRIIFREMELATKNKPEKLKEFIQKMNLQPVLEWAKENIQSSQGRFRKLSGASLSSAFFSSSFFQALTSGNASSFIEQHTNLYANRISYDIFCLMSSCPVGVLPNTCAITWVQKVVNLVVKPTLGFKIIKHRFQPA